MALSPADKQALVTALWKFLQNHPAVTPVDMQDALTVLSRRLSAAQNRDAANAEAQTYGLPPV